MANLINKTSGIKRTTLSMNKRWAVYSSDNFTCRACNKKGYFVYKGVKHGNESNDAPALNIDHVKSLTEGGADIVTNMHTLCAECNSLKGTMGWQEFLSKHYPEHKSILPQVIKETTLLDPMGGRLDPFMAQIEGDWSSMLYRPLPKDDYQAFVCFSIAVRTQAVREDDLFFYGMSRMMCEDFAKTRGLTLNDLEDFMILDNYTVDCRKELKTGMEYESFNHLDTLKKNRSNMQALTFVQEALKEESKAGSNNIMIQQNVYNNIAERHNLAKVVNVVNVAEIIE
jgi:hypothetical protein